MSAVQARREAPALGMVGRPYVPLALLPEPPTEPRQAQPPEDAEGTQGNQIEPRGAQDEADAAQRDEGGGTGVAEADTPEAQRCVPTSCIKRRARRLTLRSCGCVTPSPPLRREARRRMP